MQTPSLAGSLDGRVAIITGAGSGMGAATARLFGRAGAQVILSDIDQAGGHAVAASIAEAGGTATFVRCDVSREDDVAQLVAATVERFGRLDCAVNNAAIHPDERPIVDADLAMFDRQMAVNLRSILLCMKYQFRQFLAQRSPGSIVNIGSVSSQRARPNNAGYVAAKHGMIGLTRTGALEGAPDQIRVNAVLPGAIETPMLQESLRKRNVTAADIAPNFSLLGRLGRPEEVAEASLWLCSDMSSYVTGQLIAVDGGYLGR